MNFLAHAYLSGNDKEILLGNFIGDSVKGSDLGKLPERVQQGVLLHRKIDTFTDSHSVVRESVERLRPVYRKYSGVIIDMFYDHYLARNWIDHSSITLNEFANDVYSLMKLNYDILPSRSQQMLPYMIQYNWLVLYAQIEGLEIILTQMANRATFESNMEKAGKELREKYHLFENEFNRFFSELKQNVELELNK